MHRIQIGPTQQYTASNTKKEKKKQQITKSAIKIIKVLVIGTRVSGGN